LGWGNRCVAFPEHESIQLGQIHGRSRDD
jgi:hypothetical protein